MTCDTMKDYKMTFTQKQMTHLYIYAQPQHIMRKPNIIYESPNILYVSFLCRIPKLVVALVCEMLAATDKTHQSVDVVFSEYLSNVLQRTSICGMSEQGHEATLFLYHGSHHEREKDLVFATQNWNQ